MKIERTLGGIAVLVVAFASPALAKGTDHEGQHGASQGQQSSQSQGSQSQGSQGQRSSQSQQSGQDSQSQASRSSSQQSGTESQSGWSGLSQAQIESVQQALQQRGHYQGNIDGIAGPNTRAAVRGFQKQNGINAAGQLDEATMNALGVNLERQPVRGTQMSERQPGVGVEGDSGSGRSAATRQSGMSPGAQAETQHELTALTKEQARELQVRLHERGFYQGEIDGKIGPATRAALSRFFQRQSQLAAQGKLSDSALNAFGMDANEIQPVRGTDESRGGPGRGNTE